MVNIMATPPPSILPEIEGLLIWHVSRLRKGIEVTHEKTGYQPH